MSFLFWDKRIDTNLIYPSFLASIAEIVFACAERGVGYIATEGYRTFKHSNELVVAGELAAPGGKSAHNYGLAIDFAPVINGKVPEPKTWTQEMFLVLGEETRKHGQVWGGDWGKQDNPHVNLKGFTTGSDLLPLFFIEKETGEEDLIWLKRVWQKVGQLSGGVMYA